MKNKSQKAFTLIEFIVAISILSVLAIFTYAPYNYYSNKSKVRITGKEISQALHEARNMAINGVISSSGNVSIGVYLDNSANNKNKLQVLSYPHNIPESNIESSVGGDIKLLKTYNLQNGIEIDKIEGKNDFLFFFESITGNVSYFTNDGGSINGVSGTDTDKIEIEYSYKNSSSFNLKGEAKYYTQTNTVDYK